MLLHRCPRPPKTPPPTFDLRRFHILLSAPRATTRNPCVTREKKKGIFLSFHVIVLLCSAAPYEICPEDYAVSMVWRRTPSGELAFNRCPPNATGTDMSNDSYSVCHTGLVSFSPQWNEEWQRRLLLATTGGWKSCHTGSQLYFFFVWKDSAPIWCSVYPETSITIALIWPCDEE